MNRFRWPEHPHPLDEESLLSWLTRVASCYEFTMDDLLKYDLGFHGDSNVLNVNVPAELLTSLSNRTGISEQKIRALTLASWEPLLFNDITEMESDFQSYVHHYSLLLPLSKRKKNLPKQAWKPWLPKSLAASKACPECIKNSPVGAMSLAWCLPIMLSCPIHQCVLRECYSYQGRHLYWSKESDLMIPFSSAINTMDQLTWSALTTGKVVLPRRTIHGGVWLRLLRTLLDELHISIPSATSLHANIVNIWDSLGLMPRGGQARWQPYEKLPLETQQLTLMAAATAIEQIKNGTITPPGKQIYLFLPEPVSSDDLPSYPHQGCGIQSIERPLLRQQTFDAMNEVIELAKKDPVDAMRLRGFILFGKVDFESIQKADKLLIEVGIPPEFLVT
ncbi:MAG: TniQ family protein [Legionellaceae bacterium]|nr:TniQ family protein [Legionellaceae bacterium]